MNRYHVSFAIAAAAACLVPHGRADAGVPVPHPVPQVSARIRIEGDSVVAKDAAGVELWRVRHASVKWLEPRQGEPLAFGRRMYYGHHCYLMALDPAAGRIVRRVAYPGRISSIEPREASLAVFVEVVIDRGRKLTVRKEFAFDPQRPATPALPIDGETAVPAPMLDAHRLLEGFDIKRKPAGAELAVARGVYDRASAANPTNPWFMFDKGVLLRHLGRRGEARAAFRALVAAESAPAFDFLRISALLAMMGEMSESDLAFERGYGELVRSGVEPELVLSREAFVRLYAMPVPAAPSAAPSADIAMKGSPPAPEGRTAHAMAVAAAREAGDVDCMARLTERVWRLAPGCPGATSAFAGLAEHLQKNGRASEASIWFARAREAARLEGPVGVRQAFDAGVACFAALVLLLLVVFAKTFSRQRKDLAPLGGWLRSWRWPKERFCKMAFSYATRKELFGILLLAAAGFGFSYLAVRSEKTRLGGLPEEVSSGAWSHPRVLDLFDKLESESGKLLYGIARQEERAGSAAAEIYKPLARSDDADIAAIAENNLGVIQSRPEHFKRALELRPDMTEASYNLGEPVDSVRVSRARRYTPGRKLIALPTGPILAAALAESPVKVRDAGPAEGALGVHGWILVWIALGVTALVGPLTLPFMAIRSEAESPRRRSLAGLGYVVPGTSGRLAPIGGFILAGWVYCLIVFVSLLGREYAGGPDLPTQIREVFGTAGSMVFWFETALSVFAPVAFIGLWILNGILLARAGRVAGEGARPAAKVPPAETALPDKAPPAEPEAEKPRAKKAKEGKVGEIKAKEEEAKKVEIKKPKEAKPDAAGPGPREAEADKPKTAAPTPPPEAPDKKEADKTETKGEQKAEEEDRKKDEKKAEDKAEEKAQPDAKSETKPEQPPKDAAKEKKPEDNSPTDAKDPPGAEGGASS